MRSVSPALPDVRSAAARQTRVMVVDDAIVARSLVARWVANEPDLEVVATARTGLEAVNEVERAKPDVVVLDIDMPELDGLSTLPQLLQKKRDLVVIMASTLTRRNADASLKALSLGAADYIPKPETEGGIITSSDYHRELIEKIRAFGQRRIQSDARTHSSEIKPSSHVDVTSPMQKPGKPRVAASEGARAAISLRPFSPIPPRVLLVGASTGGPQALVEILPRLQPGLDHAPILITQHMPPTFTVIFAENLTRVCGRPVHEAIDGEPVLAGGIYLAPGGRHMQVARRNGTAVIALVDGPPINFCRPAVDPLFASGAEVWGSSSLALVMTGMGSDGLRGAEEVVAAGGSVIAQDEATSVIWGMPGSVAEAGLCSAVLPLDQIASATVRLFQGGHV